MHKVERQNRENVSTEQKNTHLKTQETNPDNAQEQEMLDQDSFGNLTIDEEEIQETFVEEICSGSLKCVPKQQKAQKPQNKLNLCLTKFQLKNKATTL